MARNVPSAAVKGRVPSVDDVTQQVMTWIGLSMRLSEARPMTESLGLLNELGLTMPQLVALHVIAFGGPTTMTRLIERVCLSTSAVSALLHRLVEMGLCERQDDPVDRRQHRVQVTAAGQAASDLVANLCNHDRQVEVFFNARQQTVEWLIERHAALLACLQCCGRGCLMPALALLLAFTHETERTLL